MFIECSVKPWSFNAVGSSMCIEPPTEATVGFIVKFIFGSCMKGRNVGLLCGGWLLPLMVVAVRGVLHAIGIPPLP